MCAPSASSAAVDGEAASAAVDGEVLLARAGPTRGAALVGIGLAVASQLGWGLYPVYARALLTQEPALTLEFLLVALNALSAAELVAMSAAARAVNKICRSKTVPGGTATRSAPLTWRVGGVVIGFGCVIATRATTNLASAAYAPAHWCVMINLTTPVFTAAIGRFVFRDPLPTGTILALVLSLSGSALAIFGGLRSGGGGGGAPLASLVLGVSLALISSVALAVYQHVVKRTKGMLSEKAVLALNYVVVLVPACGVLAVEQAKGSFDVAASVGGLRAQQWVNLVVMSLVVYLGANLAQQLAIRRLGPTLVAAVMPLRLISAVAGSYALLGEGITSAAEAAGLLIVALCAAAYLGRQVFGRRASVTKTSASANKDMPVEACTSTPAGTASPAVQIQMS